jgi:hypothetical protein
MQTNRSKLLITLALLCVVAFAPAARAASVSLGYIPVESGAGNPVIEKPGATPNSGEPDVGQGQMPQPMRYSVTVTRGAAGPTVAPVSGRLPQLSEALRWARVFWMARILGLAP